MNDTDNKFKALEQLPPFPAIATKVLRALSHQQTNVQEIADLIRADASLASELLRIVNSPLHTVAVPISSIQQAMMYLGFDEVRRFVLAVSMKAFLHAPARLDIQRGIWRHSLACAILSEDLSVACSASQSRDDRAYTTGLLHDVGRLALLVAHGQTYVDVLLAETTGRDLLDRERSAFGFDHCEAGGWLAVKWGLPEEVRAAAAGHHNPPTPGNGDLENLVRIGMLLADHLGFDVTPPSTPRTLREIRAMLPHTAQFRFDPEPAALKARITNRLDSFD